MTTGMGETDEVNEAMEARARAWLLRMRSGEATSEEVDAYWRWRAEHPEQDSEARLLGRTWGRLDAVMTELAAESTTGDRAAHDAVFGQTRATRFTPSPWRPGRRAFVGAAVAAGASWLALRPPMHLWPALGDFTADYRTGVGEQRRVTLADRTVVEMNTQTRIDVLPVGDVRAAQGGIHLIAGEAELVTGAQGAPLATGAGLPPASAHPFVVVAGRGRLQAYAARFDIRRTGDEVCVTCVSGTVALDHPRRQLTLSASQQLIYDERDVRPVSEVDSRTVTAWRRGMLVFRGAPLAEVVDEINRYRPGKVILRNAQLRELPIQAQFSIAHLDGAVEAICSYSGAHATQLPGNIVLLG
jgi:transmembrane sensor